MSIREIAMTGLLPTFLSRLASSDVKNVFLCGCGGGFDFVHTMLLYPELMQLGKQVTIGSYSFGQPQNLTGNAEVVFRTGNVIAKRVNSQTIGPKHYAPEVHLCRYLDRHYPDDVPHHVYAYYARDFAVPTLTALYRQLVEEHNIDTIIMFDGGSDSLMVGDEAGLGDPIEDAVSIATVAALSHVSTRFLVNVGFGADRFNDVSDMASLRAVADLTASGGYLGSVGLEQAHLSFAFYRDCIDFIERRQTFQSVIANAIISATDGAFGTDTVPKRLSKRVRPGEFFTWPLMAFLWAFDVEKVASRSRIVDWIHHCETPQQCMVEVGRERSEMDLWHTENLPRHEDMRYDPTRNI